MSTVKTYLLDSNYLGFFYFTEDAVKLAKECLSNERYNITNIMVDFHVEGEKAAEEMFDLTNNPSRQAERSVRYGRGRSISVGDIVEVDKVLYVCRPRGWEKVV